MARQRLILLLQNLFIAIKHPHTSLRSCHPSLLVRTDVLRHLYAGFNEFKPLSQTEDQVPHLLQEPSAFGSGDKRC